MVTLTVTVEDRYGVPYRLRASGGGLPADGRRHTLGVDIADAAGAPSARPRAPRADRPGAGRPQPPGGAEHHLVVSAIRTVEESGGRSGSRDVTVARGYRWDTAATSSEDAAGTRISRA
ncbi:hypothetical protein NKH77_18695 [Streptomyces sp. M19]